MYSKYHHYSLDYSKTAPGTEWSLKGFTFNRFKYPNDPRIDQNSDVGSRALGAGAWRIGGKLFVGRSNQEGYRFELYRQEAATDGELLVPSFRMGAGGDKSNHFYNPQTKAWNQKPKKDGLYNQYWNIAKNGDLFTIGDPQRIIHYKFGGLDAHSNPIWDASNATASVVSEFKPARRLVYDSDADVMYMAGDVKDQNWGSFLRVKSFRAGPPAIAPPATPPSCPIRTRSMPGTATTVGHRPRHCLWPATKSSFSTAWATCAS